MRIGAGPFQACYAKSELTLGTPYPVYYCHNAAQRYLSHHRRRRESLTAKVLGKVKGRKGWLGAADVS